CVFATDRRFYRLPDKGAPGPTFRGGLASDRRILVLAGDTPMKTTVVAGIAAAAIVAASGDRAVAQAPTEPQRAAQEARDFMVLAGRGAEIGVQVADGKDSGVVIEEVRPDSPAEKAGMKRSDVVVTFDGERVRSV